MGAGADDAIESRDKRRNKASKQIWENSDEETKAIRIQKSCLFEMIPPFDHNNVLPPYNTLLDVFMKVR